MHAAVFLDRDNTLIHNDGDLGDPGQVRLIQGAASAIASLRGLGYKIVVISNQGGVARGKYDEAAVDAVNQRVNDAVKAMSGAFIDRFYYCPYHPEGTVEKYRAEHPWRKPAPGMLLAAAKDLGLDLAQSWMIGDQLRDVQAGSAAGARTILLTPDAPADHVPLLTEPRPMEVGAADSGTHAFVARNLVEAVRIIAQARKPESEDPRKPDVAGKTARATMPAVTPKSMPAPLPGEAIIAPAVLPLSPSPLLGERVGVRGDTRTATEGIPLRPVDREPNPIPKAPPASDISPSNPAPPATDPAPASSADATLRQILQELRAQRQTPGEFSYLTVTAIVLQMLAGVCLLGGLWMARDDDALFLRWFGAAVVAQLATITVLLFSRRA